MNLISKIKFLVVLVASAVIFSCTVEEGQDGANGLQGVQGEQGPAGQDGVNGQNGADGEDGNANVIASSWMAATFPQNGPSFFESMVILDETINQQHLDSSVLLLYGRSIEDIWQLPVVIDGRQDYNSNFSLGQIEILAFAAGSSSENLNFFNAFRYVIIPSSGTTGKNNAGDIKSQMKKAKVDFNDYYAVCDYLELEY